jgi:hypothetical protein
MRLLASLLYLAPGRLSELVLLRGRSEQFSELEIVVLRLKGALLVSHLKRPLGRTRG